MSIHVDSSILIAALVDSEPQHQKCLDLLARGDASVLAHAFCETFSALTGGRLSLRVLSSIAAEALEFSVLPLVQPITLSTAETMAAFRESEKRGVRGGAIYDYLHLVAARKAGARRLYTLDLVDFRSFHRPGDPEIAHP